MKLNNRIMAFVNLGIAIVLAMLGLVKLGTFGLLCGVPSLVLSVYYFIGDRSEPNQ